MEDLEEKESVIKDLIDEVKEEFRLITNDSLKKIFKLGYEGAIEDILDKLTCICDELDEDDNESTCVYCEVMNASTDCFKERIIYGDLF